MATPITTAKPPPEHPAQAHRIASDDPQAARWVAGIPGDGDGHNACMDSNQARIIELLREVHLIAFKEIERLNLRIVELENQDRQPVERPIIQPTVNPATPHPPKSEIMNERQVAEYLNMSVASVRRWRFFRKGPKFVKIGSAVRYKHGDVETWLDSCHSPK